MNDIPRITHTLSRISDIMTDAPKYLTLRFALERYEKEANEGNIDSQTLISIVYQYERLINALLKHDEK